MRNRSSAGVIVLLIAGFVTGCVTSQHVVSDYRATAKEAAIDRARFDGCHNPSAAILEEKPTAPPVGTGDWVASGGRHASYVIQITGCGTDDRRYDVACVEGSGTCAATPQVPHD
jgi:hypothetical protein